jgi:hypothetical protein
MCIANVVIAYISIFFENVSPALYSLKDIPYYVLFIIFFILIFTEPEETMVKKKDFIWIVAVGYLFLSMLISHAGITSIIAAVRQMVAFLILYQTVVWLSKNNKSIKIERFIGFAISVAIPIIIFGWTEQLFSLWDNDVVRHYFAGKSIGIVKSGYPAHFIAPLFPGMYLGDNNQIVRETSIFLDPINYGHILVFWISVSWYYEIPHKKFYRYLFNIACFISLILTVSKGAVLQLLLIFILLNDRINLIFRYVCLFVIAILGYLSYEFFLNIKIHVDGFLLGIKSAGFFGAGLGMVGNYATMLGTSINEDIGDSFLGSLFGQVGWIGVTIFISILCIIYMRIPKSSIIRKILLSQFIVSMFSDNAFNISSCFAIAIACGVVVSKSNKEASGGTFLLLNENV